MLSGLSGDGTDGTIPVRLLTIVTSDRGHAESPRDDLSQPRHQFPGEVGPAPRPNAENRGRFGFERKPLFPGRFTTRRASSMSGMALIMLTTSMTL